MKVKFGIKISSEKLMKIAKYVNVKMGFFGDTTNYGYGSDYSIFSEEEYQRENIENQDALRIILDIMRRQALSDEYHTLQIQLSKIVLYWLAKNCWGWHILSSHDIVNNKKLYYLAYVPCKNIKKAYSLTYTDLVKLSKLTGCSYQYMFTGIRN